MKHCPIVVRFLATLAAVVLLVACGSSSKKTSPGTSGGTTSSTVPSSSSTVKKQKPPKLRLAKNARLGKQIIVNPFGQTVYMYVPDGSATTSKVPAALKKTWPPVVPTGNLTVGPGLSQSKIAKHKQPNGVEQVSYNGHLLYRFTGDKKPGDTNGQGLGGVWFALSATGDKLT